MSPTEFNSSKNKKIVLCQTKRYVSTTSKNFLLHTLMTKDFFFGKKQLPFAR